MMYDFVYVIDLKNGFRKAGSLKETNVISITIEAENRATADRAISALLKDAPNAKVFIGLCLQESCKNTV